jgi:seryl-tRNA synthetase
MRLCEITEKLYTLPNLPLRIVPVETQRKPNFWSRVKFCIAWEHNHWELVKKYDIIDFELGNKIAGAGFPVYKGKGRVTMR